MLVFRICLRWHAMWAPVDTLLSCPFQFAEVKSWEGHLRSGGLCCGTLSLGRWLTRRLWIRLRDVWMCSWVIDYLKFCECHLLMGVYWYILLCIVAFVWSSVWARLVIVSVGFVFLVGSCIFWVFFFFLCDCSSWFRFLWLAAPGIWAWVCLCLVFWLLFVDLVMVRFHQIRLSCTDVYYSWFCTLFHCAWLSCCCSFGQSEMAQWRADVYCLRIPGQVNSYACWWCSGGSQVRYL